MGWNNFYENVKTFKAENITDKVVAECMELMKQTDNEGKCSK